MQTVDIETVTFSPAPIGFLTWAKEHFRCARSLPVSSVFSPVPLFLRGRALELALKAFLLARGYTDEDVVDIKHRLRRALNKALDEGLETFVSISVEDVAMVDRWNHVYNTKRLEYFRYFDSAVAFRDMPADPTELDDLLDRLIHGIRDVCFEPYELRERPEAGRGDA